MPSSTERVASLRTDGGIEARGVLQMNSATDRVNDTGE
jgi:hypothetical protein